jgi:hypothetical protein
MTAAERLRRFREQYDSVARLAGLGTGERTLRQYVRRVTPGDLLFGRTNDRRGGPGRPKPRVTGPSGTRFYFEALLRRRELGSVKAAWSEADETAARLSWPRFGLGSAWKIARSLPAGTVRVRSYMRRRGAGR